MTKTQIKARTGAKTPPAPAGFALWLCLPAGILYPAARPPGTIEPGDERTLQVRARRREYLDAFRERWCPEAGEVLTGEQVSGCRMDYPYRCYLTPEALAAAMARMALEVSSEVFKPLTEGPEGLADRELAAALHASYNRMWQTQLTDLSDGTSSYDAGAWQSSAGYDATAPEVGDRLGTHYFPGRRRTCTDCGAPRPPKTPAGAEVSINDPFYRDSDGSLMWPKPGADARP